MIRCCFITFSLFIPFLLFTQNETKGFDTTLENFRIDEARLDSGDVFTFYGLYFSLGSYEFIDTSRLNYVAAETYSAFLRSNEVWLMTIADYMFRHPTYIIEIGVHSDCRGSKYSSRVLSQRRAESICNELVMLGVVADRLIPKGFEDSQPYLFNNKMLTCAYIGQFSKKEQEALHQKNRRFQIRVIAKDYVPLKESP